MDSYAGIYSVGTLDKCKYIFYIIFGLAKENTQKQNCRIFETIWNDWNEM